MAYNGLLCFLLHGLLQLIVSRNCMSELDGQTRVLMFAKIRARSTEKLNTTVKPICPE